MKFGFALLSTLVAAGALAQEPQGSMVNLADQSGATLDYVSAGGAIANEFHSVIYYGGEQAEVSTNSEYTTGHTLGDAELNGHLGQPLEGGYINNTELWDWRKAAR